MPLLEFEHDLTVDFIDIGQGSAVLLVHSAGMGAAQWRALARRLKERHRCLAPNLRGYGRSTPWPEGRPTDPAAELALLEAAAQAARGEPLHLVGHSMGAWLALGLARAAIAGSGLRLASLTLIEPVVLGALRVPGEEAALAEVAAMIEDVLAAFARGDVAAAMERFTDYWYGPGAWGRIPLAQRLPIFARAGKMRADVEAVWADRAPAGTYAPIALPTLVLSAARTTPAAARMAALLAAALPRAERGTIAGAGHMAPVTDPDACAAALLPFLARMDAAG
jgi:pimeloyl-ACP methyl ester carboxylesterase